ncbi:hypothetical protein K504DRAFT_498323 [Pleomassaria siparia CBS 279.74]|uniref:mRNA N(6)-methyladenine demethylase n=1 Tax=Pleomassaria siparia CBS 279.74 TaxID=1314801 RepID=A0A6G1KLK8_9PLEO|nr:hypothetical protein K504DRAFT_498323 [Pleomassaria siparia CBS 279.74]
MPSLDPLQRPPDAVRDVYKKYQRMKRVDLDSDHGIVHLERSLDLDVELPHLREQSSSSRMGKASIVDILEREQLNATFRSFAGSFTDDESSKPVPVYEHENMPGLHIIPNLLPPEIQTILLSRLLHRDLSCPSHLTNIHTHYDLKYPSPESSFFSFPPISSIPLADPLDPSVHRPLDISSLLNRKIRWMTLGGQYDWTEKRYPKSLPPDFPQDLKDMLQSLFPGTKAEAAIVNLYSPGDTLSVHRDVAEECGKGLISVSLGCDAIFVIGTSPPSQLTNAKLDSQSGNLPEEDPPKILTIRLGSGSVVYMSGASRFAWHGVPQIVPDTCPDYLKNWPAGADGEFEQWRGWMSKKRVNLNVRQMRN